MNDKEREYFLVISEVQANFLFPDGWDEDELKERGYIINHPIDENDLTLWDDLNRMRDEKRNDYTM